MKNTVIVNEREAEIVRSIFAVAADGMNSGQIARRLFEEKVPMATQLRYPDRSTLNENHTWSSSMVRCILDNRFYLGEMTYGKSVRKSVLLAGWMLRNAEFFRVKRDFHPENNLTLI